MLRREAARADPGIRPMKRCAWSSASSGLSPADRPAAERDLLALTTSILARVDARIRGLADILATGPNGFGARKWFRLRVGAYRVLYEVDDAQQMVIIARVRHRRDVYRGL